MKELTMWVLVDGKKVNLQNDGGLLLFPTKKRAEAFLDNFWLPSGHNWKPKKMRVTDAT